MKTVIKDEKPFDIEVLRNNLTYRVFPKLSNLIWLIESF